MRVFGKYPSFQKAKVVRDKRTNKTKGFGFVSFKDPQDFIKAMKEMNGKSSVYFLVIDLTLMCAEQIFLNYGRLFSLSLSLIFDRNSQKQLTLVSIRRMFVAKKKDK